MNKYLKVFIVLFFLWCLYTYLNHNLVLIEGNDENYRCVPDGKGGRSCKQVKGGSMDLVDCQSRCKSKKVSHTLSARAQKRDEKYHREARHQLGELCGAATRYSGKPRRELATYTGYPMVPDFHDMFILDSPTNLFKKGKGSVLSDMGGSEIGGCVSPPCEHPERWYGYYGSVQAKGKQVNMDRTQAKRLKQPNAGPGKCHQIIIHEPKWRGLAQWNPSMRQALDGTDGYTYITPGKAPSKEYALKECSEWYSNTDEPIHQRAPGLAGDIGKWAHWDKGRTGSGKNINIGHICSGEPIAVDKYDFFEKDDPIKDVVQAWQCQPAPTMCRVDPDMPTRYDKPYNEPLKIMTTCSSTDKASCKNRADSVQSTEINNTSLLYGL